MVISETGHPIVDQLILSIDITGKDPFQSAGTIKTVDYLISRIRRLPRNLNQSVAMKVMNQAGKPLTFLAHLFDRLHFLPR